jgi:hypothetical protein
VKHVQNIAIISLIGLVIFLAAGYFTDNLDLMLPVVAVAGFLIAVTLLIITYATRHNGHHHAPAEPLTEHHLHPVHEAHTAEPAVHRVHHEQKPEETHHLPKVDSTHTEHEHHHAYSAQHYVEKMRKAGMPDHEIKQRLLSVGWDKLAVDIEMMKR